MCVVLELRPNVPAHILDEVEAGVTEIIREAAARHRAPEIADARRMDGEREILGEGEC